jgi:GT2 family glycosyltransferase
MTGTLIAIPFYRNVQFIALLLQSLGRCIDDLKTIGAEILLIVDSPDDQALIGALRLACTQHLGPVPHEIIINDANLGFIRSVNLALERAVSTARDIIILNSDVEVFPGALSEMRDVAATDHMIGFVSPRSNNATICSMPWDERYRNRSPAESYADFRLLRDRLPRVNYVPLVVGFAVYIKARVLADLGLLDEIYGLGYNEENDLILRANRRGYSAAIANRAFVYHLGEGSFGQLDEARNPREIANRRIFDSRYPEYSRAISTYFKSTSFHADRLLDSLIPQLDGKFNVAFDLSPLGLFHNGTFRAAKKILEAFARHFGDRYHLFAICAEDVFAFHDIARLGTITCVELEDAVPLTAIIRIGQPFSAAGITGLRYRSPLLAVLMLDTIALDSLYLNNGGLHALWQMTLDLADRIFLNSGYTRHQIEQRFRIDDPMRLVPLLHSTDIAEYEGSRRDDAQPAVLLIGNAFTHKAMEDTILTIRAAGVSRKVIVFGIAGTSDAQFEFVPGGHLSEENVDQLYARCSVVLFPSHYEGFGFPILDAFRRGKPVVARTMPVYAEIAAACPQSLNLHLFSTTQEMVDAALSGTLAWTEARSATATDPVRWVDSAVGIHAFLSEAIAGVTHRDLNRKLSIAGRFSDVDQLALTRVFEQTVTKMQPAIGRASARIRRAGRARARLRAEVELLRISPFFDPVFYLANNTDVAKVGADPVLHFAEYGWREARNPSPYFDVTFYTETHKDIAEGSINPVVHYHMLGVFEGREIQSADGAVRMRLTVDASRASGQGLVTNALNGLKDRLGL